VSQRLELDVGIAERRPMATASRSRDSRTRGSRSDRDPMTSTRPRSGRSSPASSKMVRARASHPFSTAQSPNTLPAIQATMHATRPAAVVSPSRR
jgi:hypothetical protein